VAGQPLCSAVMWGMGARDRAELTPVSAFRTVSLDVSTVLHRRLYTRRHCPYRAKDSSIEFRMGRRREVHLGKA
jgi:hypothetical protein